MSKLYIEFAGVIGLEVSDNISTVNQAEAKKYLIEYFSQLLPMNVIITPEIIREVSQKLALRIQGVGIL